VARKPNEEYAVLAVSAAQLCKRLKAKNIGIRELARLCGHESHTHIWKITKGHVKTTSPHTANVIEATIDAKGLIFARSVVQSRNKTAA
jgi:hypothetical protein